MRVGRSFLTAITAVVAAAVVAACGGSSNTADQTGGGSTVTVTRTKTVTQPQTTSTGPLTDTTPTKTTTTAHGAGPACNTSDLTPSYLGSNGAAGTIVLGFALKNTGTSTCHTYGWPGVKWLSPSGKPLPTSSFQTTGDVIGKSEPSVLTLKPGEEASFRIVASDVASGGASCPTVGALQIYPPDDTATVKVSLPGMGLCASLTYSPLLPGTSAFAEQGGGGQSGIGSGGSGSGSGSGGSGSGGSASGGSGSGSGSGGSGGSGSGSGSGNGGSGI